MKSYAPLKLAALFLSGGALACCSPPAAPVAKAQAQQKPQLGPSTRAPQAAPPPVAPPQTVTQPASVQSSAPGDEASAGPLSLRAVNGAGFTPPTNAAAPSKSDPPDATLIKAEVLLDRANFSPGVIDGRMGENVKNALVAYEKAHGLAASPTLTQDVWTALSADRGAVVTAYTLTDADVAGPFTPTVGEDFVKMAKLDHVGYANAKEMLAERFHMGQDLLEALNPGADFTKSGQTVVVADPGAPTLPRVASLDVDKKTKSVTAKDADGKVLAVFPATVGSTERPSPQGVWKVKGVAQNPDYLYDPSKLTWGPKSHGKLHIPPGPNGPVGVVWIALTAPDYGIHGTPDPRLVGKTASHGCVRLTNWDAEELSKAVHPGVKVTFDS